MKLEKYTQIIHWRKTKFEAGKLRVLSLHARVVVTAQGRCWPRTMRLSRLVELVLIGTAPPVTKWRLRVRELDGVLRRCLAG